MSEPIESADHPAFAAAAALSTRLARTAAGRYLVEGGRLVAQAAAAGLLEAVFWVDEAEAVGGAPAVSTYAISARLLPKLIGTGYSTRLDAVGVVRRTPLAALPAGGLVLAGESIQDPRNVGVLIRTAEAAGCTAVVFSDDSADPYSRAAVRSSTGSILRQPLLLCADLAATLRSSGRRVVASSAGAEPTAWETDLCGDLVILVGNESDGLSPAARATADAVVRLPVHGGASSLNVTVAAGVLLYEALRRRGG